MGKVNFNNVLFTQPYISKIILQYIISLKILMTLAAQGILCGGYQSIVLSHLFFIQYYYPLLWKAGQDTNYRVLSACHWTLEVGEETIYKTGNAYGLQNCGKRIFLNNSLMIQKCMLKLDIIFLACEINGCKFETT